VELINLFRGWFVFKRKIKNYKSSIILLFPS
jgi:hypothetical protein